MIYKYAQEEFPALEDVKVLHYVRKKPWYDIIQQYENHHTETLFDTPEDYGALNRYWLEIHAHLNMRMAAEMDLLQTRDALQQHCVPYWRRPRGAASDKFCVGILPHFCPFEFTRNCQTHQAVEWSEDLTLATQLSFDRFDRLLELSKEWEGPISAAIWFPEDQWAEVVRTITLSTLPLRRVAVHLVVQSASEPFPINVLRNVAINNTLTDMVFSLDVDFMPSPFLYRRLMNKRRLRMWESTKSKHAFIVPAFEFSRPQPCVLLPQLQKDYGDTSCFVLPMSRDTMVEHLVNGSADPFHPFGKGHRATNTKRWMNATRPYYIEWESWYEPYFVARRTQFDAASHAWFDERFYGMLTCVGTWELKGEKKSMLIYVHTQIAATTRLSAHLKCTSAAGVLSSYQTALPFIAGKIPILFRSTSAHACPATAHSLTPLRRRSARNTIAHRLSVIYKARVLIRRPHSKIMNRGSRFA